MRIKSFDSYNENLEPSDSEGQYELTQKVYTYLHEKGVEFEGDGDHFEKAWDSLDIFEMIKMIKGLQLTSHDFRGLSNNYGNVPKYVDQRIGKECVALEGSWHTYNTWDSYTLYVPKNKPESPIAIMIISRSGGGSLYELVNYKKVMIVTHEVSKYL